MGADDRADVEAAEQTRKETSFGDLKAALGSLDGVGEELLALCALVFVARGTSPSTRRHWLSMRASTQSLFKYLLEAKPPDDTGIAACREVLALCAARLYNIPVRLHSAGTAFTVGAPAPISDGATIQAAPTPPTKSERGSTILAEPRQRAFDQRPHAVERIPPLHPLPFPRLERGWLALDPFAQAVNDDPFRDLLTRDAERIVRGLGKVRNPLGVRSIVRGVRRIAFGDELADDESFNRVMRRARARDIESELYHPNGSTTVLPYEPSDYDEYGRDLERDEATVWVPRATTEERVTARTRAKRVRR